MKSPPPKGKKGGGGIKKMKNEKKIKKFIYFYIERDFDMEHLEHFLLQC